MRIIALANQKGGVGKTTTTVNLGAALARRGRRVVLVDLDPQAHLTTCLGVPAEQAEPSVYELLTQSVPFEAVRRRVRENLEVAPATLNLAAAEQELVSVVGRETILRDALAAGEANWDYLLIDCPPSLGLLTLNALCAARELFIPLQPHFLALQGLSQLLESVLLVHQRINRALQVTGLLFCMYDGRTSLSGEIVRDIEGFFGGEGDRPDRPWRDIRLFGTRIRGNIKLAESPSYGQTIFEYAPVCHGANDYQALAEEVEDMTRAPGGGTGMDKNAAKAGETGLDKTASTAVGQTIPCKNAAAAGDPQATTEAPPPAQTHPMPEPPVTETPVAETQPTKEGNRDAAPSIVPLPEAGIKSASEGKTGRSERSVVS